MQKQFEEIVIQIGCPHHMNFSPDRFHSHCFMWFDRFARLNNINIQKYTELVKMGNELIAGKVTEESNSFNFIKFYDLEELKTKMPETTYEARFQWTERGVQRAADRERGCFGALVLRVDRQPQARPRRHHEADAPLAPGASGTWNADGRCSSHCGAG